MEKQYGWSIAAIKGTTITLRYKREIELAFDMERNAVSDIRYIISPDGSSDNSFHPRPCCPPEEKAFFLDCIRTHIMQPSPSSTVPVPARRLLKVVGAAWDKADAVARHVRLLNLSFPTTVRRASESSLLVTSSLLLAPLQTRVEAAVRLEVGAAGAGPGADLEVAVTPEAKVVYGEGFNAGKMTEFLAGRVGDAGGGDVSPGWDEAVLGLYKRLLAKGNRVAAAAAA